jgi:Protein of unknown function (DUF2934)
MLMPNKRTSKPAPAARATKAPVKAAAKPRPLATPSPATNPPKAPAPAKTVKIVKKPTGNQAVVVRKARISPPLLELPTQERDRLVAEAAYYLAEARGFAPGNAEADWHAAEQAIARHYRFI